MIDLHMHSRYSDGTESVIELLQKAESLGMQLISITDHDSIEAHLELQNIDVKKYFSGSVILGVEFKSYYKGVAVEVLCYNYDLEKVKNLPYLRKRTADRQKNFLEKFKRIGKEIGLKFDERIAIEGHNYFASEVFGTEIAKYEENIPVMEKYNIPLEAKFKFYRFAQTNPENVFYMDETKEFPAIDTIVYDIHDAGGLVFLAHPFVYSFEDRINHVIDIVETYGLDGIECYYSRSNEDEKKQLLDYCIRNNKYVSGGSDYHGLAHPEVDMNCVEVPVNLIDKWVNKKD